MWSQSHSAVFKNVTKEQVWKVWSDVNHWPEWNPAAESCTMTEPFAMGTTFMLKPKGGPAVQIELIEVEPYRKFTDCTKFPGATMYGIHELVEEPTGLRLTTTITISGPMSFVWRKLVAEKIVDKLPSQTETLVEIAKSQRLT